MGGYPDNFESKVLYINGVEHYTNLVEKGKFELAGWKVLDSQGFNKW